MMVSFGAALFPWDVLDESLDLIGEGFPTYSYILVGILMRNLSLVLLIFRKLCRSFCHNLRIRMWFRNVHYKYLNFHTCCWNFV